MGPLEFCCLLDRRLVQHQHVDDFVFHDHRWSLLVAGVDLRLARLLYFSLLHCHHWTHRSHIPHWFPSHWPFVFWHLGQSMACFQSCCHG